MASSVIDCFGGRKSRSECEAEGSRRVGLSLSIAVGGIIAAGTSRPCWLPTSRSAYWDSAAFLWYDPISSRGRLISPIGRSEIPRHRRSANRRQILRATLPADEMGCGAPDRREEISRNDPLRSQRIWRMTLGSKLAWPRKVKATPRQIMIRRLRDRMRASRGQLAGTACTGTFGFGVDFLDVLTERPLLLLEPLDALDEGLQLCARDTPHIRHNPLPPVVMLPPQQGRDDSLRARLAQGRDAVTRASEFRASAAAKNVRASLDWCYFC